MSFSAKRVSVLASLLLAGAIPQGTGACGGPDRIELCGHVNESCYFGCCGSLVCDATGTCQKPPPPPPSAIGDTVQDTVRIDAGEVRPPGDGLHD